MKHVSGHRGSCQAKSVLFVYGGIAPLYCRRVSALHLIHITAVYPVFTFRVCGKSHRQQQNVVSQPCIVFVGARGGGIHTVCVQETYLFALKIERSGLGAAVLEYSDRQFANNRVLLHQHSL